MNIASIGFVLPKPEAAQPPTDTGQTFPESGVGRKEDFMRKRNTGLTIRVTETEKRKIERNARKRGVSLSAYLRQAALDQELPVLDPKVFFSLIGEINQIRQTAPNLSSATLDRKLEDLTSHFFLFLTNRKEEPAHGNNEDLGRKSISSQCD